MEENKCIFCGIVAGTIPSTKIYEDADFLAFADIHPVGPGHTLIIPKTHYRYVWDVPNIGAYFEVVKKIALAQKKAFAADVIRSHYSEPTLYPGLIRSISTAISNI